MNFKTLVITDHQKWCPHTYELDVNGNVRLTEFLPTCLIENIYVYGYPVAKILQRLPKLENSFLDHSIEMKNATID